MNSFKRVHFTPNRARYKYSLLKDKSIDENILKKSLEEIDGIFAIRINKKKLQV